MRRAVGPDAIGLRVAFGRLVGFLAILDATRERQRTRESGVYSVGKVDIRNEFFLDQVAEFEARLRLRAERGDIESYIDRASVLRLPDTEKS